METTKFHSKWTFSLRLAKFQFKLRFFALKLEKFSLNFGFYRWVWEHFIWNWNFSVGIWQNFTWNLITKWDILIRIVKISFGIETILMKLRHSRWNRENFICNRDYLVDNDKISLEIKILLMKIGKILFEIDFLVKMGNFSSWNWYFLVEILTFSLELAIFYLK